MSDLWPEIQSIECEENNSVAILREQARAIDKKTNGAIKATFSKIAYKKNGLSELSKVVSALSGTSTMVEEDDLLKERILLQLDYLGEIFKKDKNNKIKDKDWHRIKVKSPAYVAISKMYHGALTKKRALTMFLEGSDIDTYLDMFPEHKAALTYYGAQLEMLKEKIGVFMQGTLSMYEELEHDRKALAMMIKDSKYARFGFEAVKGRKIEDIWNSLDLRTVISFIPDYPMVTFAEMLKEKS